MRLFKRLSDFLPVLIVAYLAWQWLPVAWQHFKTEGLPSPAFRVERLDGAMLDSVTMSKPVVIAFWATWCGPCTLELKRLQAMINRGDIARESVLAVSEESDIETIRAAVKERGYTFPVGWDARGEVFRHYKVSVTPTLVVVNAKNEIEWITSGISPSLEIRLKSYLKPGPD